MSETNRDKLNRLNPDFQEMKAGNMMVYSPVIFKKDITAAANATAVTAFTAPFAMQIVDVIVQATATSGGGAITPRNGADAMCTAIACATDGAVTHMSAGTTTPARLVLAAGDSVTLIAAGANDRGIVTIIGVRR